MIQIYNRVCIIFTFYVVLNNTICTTVDGSISDGVDGSSGVIGGDGLLGIRFLFDVCCSELVHLLIVVFDTFLKTEDCIFKAVE